MLDIKRLISTLITPAILALTLVYDVNAATPTITFYGMGSAINMSEDFINKTNDTTITTVQNKNDLVLNYNHTFQNRSDTHYLRCTTNSYVQTTLYNYPPSEVPVSISGTWTITGFIANLNFIEVASTSSRVNRYKWADTASVQARFTANSNGSLTVRTDSYAQSIRLYNITGGWSESKGITTPTGSGNETTIASSYLTDGYTYLAVLASSTGTSPMYTTYTILPFTYNPDTTSPTVSMTKATTAWVKTLNLNLLVSDTSPIGGLVFNYSSIPVGTTTVTVYNNGTHRLTASDIFSNSKTATIAVTNIDCTKPTANITLVEDP